MALDQYTLIIPTYNRPADLARLLRFLAYQAAPFRVLVLDSSRPEIHESNAAACRGVALDVNLKRFDPQMPPWEKFARGGEMVETEFASLCADDDLVLVSGIRAILDFLVREREYSVAHGWYFNFYVAGGALGLTKIIYRSPSLDDSDPLQRLWRLFSGYEAITYGVHRTSVLRRSLSLVQQVGSMLGRELLGGAVAAVSGKLARLPVLYAGRSLGPSAPYVDWHPLDFLITGPQALMDEYVRYRAQLLQHWRDCGHPTDDMAAVTKAIDLIHLRYVSEYFRPRVLEYLYAETRKGRTREEIMGGIWPVLLEREGFEGRLQKSRLLRGLRDRFAPWLRPYHIRKFTRRQEYRTEPARTASGAPRDYHVYGEFVTELSGLALTPAELMAGLNGYE